MSYESPDVLIYDGYNNGPVTVKPASTTSSVNDSSLVTITSPNQQPAINSTITGTITSGSGVNSYVSAAVQGWGSCMAVIAGTWAATLVFEISSDGGTTWFNGVFASPPAIISPIPVPLLTISTNGTYQGVGLGAITNVRVRASSFTSGTINVRLVFSAIAAGLLPGFAAIQQNVVVSLFNNSTTNLASGASFTGSTESSLGVAGIQINFKANQPCTIQVQQAMIDGYWDISDSFFIPAGTGWGGTLQATASYLRVIVTNNGGATTTYLRLQTALCPTVEALPRTLGPSGGLRVEAGIGMGGWIPSTPLTYFGVQTGQKVPLSIGPDGSLQCYSEILTDAGSFREDYPGSSLQNNLTGTMSFTNGSTLVTGSGSAFLTQLNRFAFIKLTGHADTVLASVLNVSDDNALTLTSPYTGASGTGVGIVSFWFPTIGTGGSISVANSILAMASGTTSGANTWVQRGSDYCPMEKTLRFNVSQRIANQTIRMGWFDNFASPSQQACIELTGTDNTQVTLVCRSSSNAADLESVTVTLPTGINTSTTLNLKMDFSLDRVTLYYDPADGSPVVFLAMCKNHIPGLYQSLLSGHGVLNTGVAGSTTTLNVDMVFLKDYNRLDVQNNEMIAPDMLVATCTNVAAAVADTLLLATNKLRSFATVYNDSTSILYLKFGSGASTTSFTVRLVPQAYYELPIGTKGSVYNGQINGYWAVANGSARVTEIV